MARVFVSLGSNIRPEENIRAACSALALLARVVGISNVYRTEPDGRSDQPPFYNCVVEIDTEIPPQELKFDALRRIEAGLGRQRSEDKFASRTIDLDLILYDDLVLNAEDFALPDPEISRRPYLAIPLSELAPELELPGNDVRIAQIAAGMSRGTMRLLKEYTADLRREMAGGLLAALRNKRMCMLWCC